MFQEFLSTRDTQFHPLFSARIPELRDGEPARLATPQIELVEQEGKVRRIVVTCTCCEKIEIECEYE